jgi:hypothetical protein
MTMTTPLPAPLATDADTANSHAGACSLCQRPIVRHDRYALLVASGKAAHLVCIGIMARRQTRRLVIR